MDRIRIISHQILDAHKPRFSEDFNDNKKMLAEVSIIRSKSLRNKIAGHITKSIKRENRAEKEKQEQIELAKTREEEKSSSQKEAGVQTVTTEDQIPKDIVKDADQKEPDVSTTPPTESSDIQKESTQSENTTIVVEPTPENKTATDNKT